MTGEMIQDFGEREAGGMMISRRPNRRASSESAPGPSRTIAAAIMTRKMMDSVVSSKVGAVAGNHESAMPALPNPTRMLATGVRNPIRSEAPLVAVSNATTHVSGVRLPPLVR